MKTTHKIPLPPGITKEQYESEAKVLGRSVVDFDDLVDWNDENFNRIDGGVK